MSQEYLWQHMMDKEIVPEYFRRLGYWWENDKKAKKQVEMDIVGISMDNLAGFFGECKWKNEPISKSILETLLCEKTIAFFFFRSTIRVKLFQRRSKNVSRR